MTYVMMITVSGMVQSLETKKKKKRQIQLYSTDLVSSVSFYFITFKNSWEKNPVTGSEITMQLYRSSES